jgi:hypothetical protein
MTDQPLSPAAQAVLNAATSVCHPETEIVAFQCTRLEVAAAMRAAADQAENLFVPSSYHGDSYLIFDRGQVAAAEHLRAIATELGGPVNE